VALVVIICCYVIGTPRSGGPDEPSHMVASAALVRGEREGDPVAYDSRLRAFEVPAMVGEPNPGCWAQQPFVQAGCASLQSDATDDVVATTTSSDYPPWTYVLPGVASFVPNAPLYAYLARLLMAVWPLALLAGSFSIVRRLGAGTSTAIVLGVTPIAWFSMSIVNPSAVAIAGGLATWVALFARGHRRAEWLLVAGWASLLLARRDGPLWATLIVLAVCAALAIRPSALLRTLPRWTIWALAATVPLPLLTALGSGNGGFDLLLVVTPIALVVIDVAIAAYDRIPTPTGRLAFVAASSLLAVVVIGVALAASPGGFDTGVLRLVMGNTGEHLRQLVGVLGWLDTPVPTAAVFLYWAAIGGLATLAMVEQPRIAVIGLGVIATTVVVAWILELGQGADYGRYWQGRYSMPFVVGLPLLLSVRRHDEPPPVRGSDAVASLTRPLGIVIWMILNAGFAAALQRWGVGLAGSWLPWEWSTYDAPIPPWVLLVVHALASAVLIASLWSTSEAPSSAAGASGSRLRN
jgi:hypothetical protein